MATRELPSIDLGIEVQYDDAWRILQDNIRRFSGSKMRGMPLFKFDEKEDATLYDPTGVNRERKIKKADLDVLWKRIMEEYVLKTKPNAPKRTDYDQNQQKLTPNSYWEFRKHANDKGLTFKFVQYFKDKVAVSGYCDLVESGRIDKSPNSSRPLPPLLKIPNKID